MGGNLLHHYLSDEHLQAQLCRFACYTQKGISKPWSANCKTIVLYVFYYNSSVYPTSFIAREKQEKVSS
jgi:hypothetical protein